MMGKVNQRSVTLMEGCNPLKVPGFPVHSTETIDPPLGPETEALFAEILAQLQQQTPEQWRNKGQWYYNACDLNEDSFCDAQDYIVATGLIGKCVADADYNIYVEFDGDGCITNIDVRDLFGDNWPPCAMDYDLDHDNDGKDLAHLIELIVGGLPRAENEISSFSYFFGLTNCNVP
jgi:hypothetical protein